VLTGDVFGSLRCDCRLQLELAMDRIARRARAFCFMSSRRAAHRPDAKLKAYELQDQA